MAEMQKKSWRERGFDFINSIYAGVALMAFAGIAATLYTHFGAVWEKPIINGLATAAIVLSLFLSIRAVLSLPPAAERTTPENVGPKVLTWLHKFSLTVKSCPEEGQDFFFIVTTDGGKKVAVKREFHKNPDYIIVLGYLTLNDEEKAVAKEMTESELLESLLAIQQELWRGAFGFNTTEILTEGLHISLKVPITPDIAETDVMNAIWRMEAILGNVIGLNTKTVLNYKLKKGRKADETRIPRGDDSSKQLRGSNEEVVSSS